MKLSIAMATYHGARFLDAQLDSFLAQSRLPDELVVTDDQSSDRTAEIVTGFSGRAPFAVRFERNPVRLGPAQNFGRALGLCSGDLCLLSDQDDVWHADKLQVLEQLAREDADHDCFLVDAWMADGDLRLTGATKLGQIRQAGLPDTAMVMGCCAAIRRGLLDILLPIPADQPAHDNWLVQCADLLGRTRRLSQPLQVYRRHGGNVSDFHVNRLSPPTGLAKLRERMSNLFRRLGHEGGLAAEHAFLQAAARRFEERREAIEALVGADTARTRLDAVHSRAQALGERVAIRGLPRLRRTGRILSLWRRGGYRGAGGLGGAAKDAWIGRASSGGDAA